MRAEQELISYGMLQFLSDGLPHSAGEIADFIGTERWRIKRVADSMAKTNPNLAEEDNGYLFLILDSREEPDAGD